MATFTYTTTPQEDLAIAHALGIVNAQRAAQTPPLPALTPGQYLQQVLAGAIASWLQQRQQAKQGDVAGAYLSASPAVQQQIRTELGLGTPP